MNAEQALEWMKLFNEKIQEQKDYLSELDTPIGDGDHGGNMARGMAAVMENLELIFKEISEVHNAGQADEYTERYYYLSDKFYTDMKQFKIDFFIN